MNDDGATEVALVWDSQVLLEWHCVKVKEEEV